MSDTLHTRRMRLGHAMSRLEKAGVVHYCQRTGTGYHVSVRGGQTRTFDLRGLEAFVDGALAVLDTVLVSAP